MGSRAANGLVISESYSNLNVPLKSLMLVKVALKRDPINGVIPHLAWYCPIYKMKQRAKTIRSFICALSLPFQLDRCWIHLLWLCRSSCFCRFLRYFVHKNVRSLTRWLHNSLHQSRPISFHHCKYNFFMTYFADVCLSFALSIFYGHFFAVLRPKGRRFSLYDGSQPKLR